MCGIVGYIGKRKNPQFGLECLKKLEYRGYDSAGMAVFSHQSQKILFLKAIGRIANLEKKLRKTRIEGSPFIFQTRWATHGKVTLANAHPHFDCAQNIFLVHNGIIENYKILKEKLIREGHRFSSETDTEVIAHLIEKFFKGSLEGAVQKALRFVKGTYGLVIIARDDPGKMVIARNSSPILIGLGEKEYFVASDPTALIGLTRKIIYLDDGEMAVLTPSGFSITDFNQNRVEKKTEELGWKIAEAQKEGFPHFMLKEIFETPEAVRNAIRGRLILGQGRAKLGGLEVFEEELKRIKRIIISACGSSYFVGLVGECMLEEYAGVPVEVEYGSEFRYKKIFSKEKIAFLAISQSGETADTLAALRKAKNEGILTLAIVNVVGSSLAREAAAGVYNYAGPEIAVACTKAFVSQLTVLILLTLFLGRQRKMSKAVGQELIREIREIPQKIETVLSKSFLIEKLARKYKNFDHFLFIGRKYNFPIALEGAMKLKEVSYVHAEGYPAGEMKHGPIALIDKNFPTLAIAPSDSTYEKMISNIEEIKARNGRVIAVATSGNREIKKLVDDVVYLPPTLEIFTPILNVIPLQLFAYYVAFLRGRDVDKPRNLAKSVTVE